MLKCEVFSMIRLCSILSFALLALPVNSVEKPKYTSDNLIIATDLDDVLLKRKNGVIFKTIFTKFPQCKKLYKLYKERNKTGSTGEKFGEGFYLYLKNEGLDKLANIIKDFCLAKKIKKRTLKIMRNMANQGYEFYTATNIGSIFFAELQKKFPETFNNVFIKHGMTVDFSQDEVIQKPDHRYFEQLKAKLNPDNDRDILFIDDKLENVTAARECGLLAIHFKSAKKLTRDLHNYGICTCN